LPRGNIGFRGYPVALDACFSTMPLLSGPPSDNERLRLVELCFRQRSVSEFLYDDNGIPPTGQRSCQEAGMGYLRGCSIKPLFRRRQAPRKRTRDLRQGASYMADGSWSREQGAGSREQGAGSRANLRAYY